MVVTAILKARIPPANGTLSTTMGSFTFIADSPVVFGRIAAFDMPYFIDPGYPVKISWTPAPTTLGGFAVNSAMKNPGRGLQGFDARNPDYYSAVNSNNVPVPMRANDSLVVQKHNPNPNVDGGGSATKPVWNLEFGAILCLSAAPAVNASIPPSGPYGNGIAARPVDVLDPTTITFPGYSLVEAVESIDSLIGRMALFNPGISIVSAVEGKRQHTVSGYTIRDGYGKEVSDIMSDVGIRLIGDDTLAKRQTLAKHVWAQARTNYHNIKASSAKWASDGGQNQGEAGKMILAAGWMGNTAELAAMRTDIETNELISSFKMTTALLAKLRAPHSIVANDYARINLRKTITGITGNVLAFTGANASLEWNAQYAVLEIVRESDGATALTTDYAFQSLTINAQPAVPFAVNDVVYCRAPYPQADGEFEWAIKGLENAAYYSPDITDSYRTLNKWSGSMMACQAFGFMHSTWGEHFRGYIVRANQLNNPNATYDYPTHNNSAGVEAFWNRMWPTISAVAQTVG